MVRCPECERRFDVVWSNDGLGPPEYCPMCGAEIDYSQSEEETGVRLIGVSPARRGKDDKGREKGEWTCLI